ncbi:hypothetical protein [Bdellovibrio bacteriovorus]|uniref:hypothetical protein n=1 Tax=Bdellovibrio bacteriovorus TaxID=959 RepID=UPI0035A838D6
MNYIAATLLCVLSISLSAHARSTLMLEEACGKQAVEIVEATRKALHDYQTFHMEAEFVDKGNYMLEGLKEVFEYKVLMRESNGDLRPIYYIVHLGVTSLDYDRCDVVLRVKTKLPNITRENPQTNNDID